VKFLFTLRQFAIAGGFALLAGSSEIAPVGAEDALVTEPTVNMPLLVAWFAAAVALASWFSVAQRLHRVRRQP